MGKSLGRAFFNLPRGPGIAYFPAVSLTWGESIVANFGGSPFQFPTPAFSPLQSERSAEDSKTHTLLVWLDRIRSLYSHPQSQQNLSPQDYLTLVIATSRIFEFLGPNIQSPFVLQQSFLPFFGEKLGLPQKISLEDRNLLSSAASYQNIHLLFLLDLMWTFLFLQVRKVHNYEH